LKLDSEPCTEYVEFLHILFELFIF
jgi:hypothetical protein